MQKWRIGISDGMSKRSKIFMFFFSRFDAPQRNLAEEEKREDEWASELGDLLDLGVTSRWTNPTKKTQIRPLEKVCYQPKKTKENVEGNAASKSCYSKKIT